MKNRLFAILLCVLVLLALLPATAQATTQISSLSLKGYKNPEAGKSYKNFLVLTTNEPGASFYDIDWHDDTANRYLEGNDTFQAGHIYSVQIWMEAEDGYAFRCVDDYTPGITATLDGKKLTVTKAYEYKAFAMVVLSYTFPKISQATPEHTHVYTDWQYNFGQHYKHCTDCDEIFFLEAHKGGVVTCEEPGRCTVCGYAYIEPSEDYHVPDTSKWIARVDMYHYHACSICGAHCDIADHRWSPKVHPVDASGHAYQCADCKGYDKVKPHKPGPAATEDKPQTCTECGYVIATAKNHVHDLSRVPQTPATCTEGGNIEYYFCTGCNDCFTDPDAKNKIPETMTVLTNPLGHKASDQWHISEHHHWRTCSTCGVLLEETQMLHEGEPCATCGYAAAEKLPQATQPTEPQIGKSRHQMTSADWLWVLCGTVGGASIGGLSVMLLLKKKKK